MRKVTAGLFHSVDGVVQDPFKFQFDSFDEDLGKGLSKMITTVDTVVLGRVSYQEWAGYWPNASQDDDFAAFINPVEKFVASQMNRSAPFATAASSSLQRASPE